MIIRIQRFSHHDDCSRVCLAWLFYSTGIFSSLTNGFCFVLHLYYKRHCFAFPIVIKTSRGMICSCSFFIVEPRSSTPFRFASFGFHGLKLFLIFRFASEVDVYSHYFKFFSFSVLSVYTFLVVILGSFASFGSVFQLDLLRVLFFYS